MRYGIMMLAVCGLMFASAHAQEFKKKGFGKEKEPEPSKSTEITEIHGRSFKEWERDISDKDPTRRELAIKTILLFGPDKAYEAVPEILAELKRHTARTPVDLSVRIAGTTALGTIFKFKKDPDPKDIKAAVAIFKTYLKDEQLMLRIQAVQGLPFLGPTCRGALPEVYSLAREPSTWEARKDAVQTLGFIGYEDKGTPNIKAMSEVFRLLDDRAAPVRIAAIRASGALAMKAELPVKMQVYGKFKTAENDLDKHVVIAAHMTHMMLEGKASAAHLNPLVKMLKDENPEVRLDALQNISGLGKEAKSILPKLIECTSDPEVSVAASAIIVLAGVDWENTRTVIERIKDSKSYPDVVRAAASDAIAFHEKMAKEKKKSEK
jgi:HEAT repeat protein